MNSQHIQAEAERRFPIDLGRSMLATHNSNQLRRREKFIEACQWALSSLPAETPSTKEAKSADRMTAKEIQGEAEAEKYANQKHWGAPNSIRNYVMDAFIAGRASSSLPAEENNENEITFKVKIGSVNDIHTVISRTLNPEEQTILRDKLIRRTPPLPAKENKLLEDFPENKCLYKDSGLWQMSDEDNEDVFVQQTSNETDEQFIIRCKKYIPLQKSVEEPKVNSGKEVKTESIVCPHCGGAGIDLEKTVPDEWIQNHKEVKRAEEIIQWANVKERNLILKAMHFFADQQSSLIKERYEELKKACADYRRWEEIYDSTIDEGLEQKIESRQRLDELLKQS